MSFLASISQLSIMGVTLKFSLKRCKKDFERKITISMFKAV